MITDAWTTPSKYVPNREALAHFAAAARNAVRNPCDADPCTDKKCKVHKHVMSAEILMRDAAVYTGVALSKEDIDRHAAQQTKRKTRAAIRAAQDRGIK